MTKEEIIKRYKGKSIGEIEAEISANRNNSAEAQQKMVYGLCALKYSGRWKENPVYKTSSFETYLMGMWSIRSGTFRDWEHAYLHFPEEAKRYGTGVVAKARRECGAVKEKRVLSEINALQKERKQPITRQAIDKVIEKYTPPKAEKQSKPDAAWWEMKYNEEAKAHHDEIKAHNETKQELKEAREQIERLKATVLELQPWRDVKEVLRPLFGNA